MAKKAAKPAANGADAIKICFERILPEELDAERNARHRIRDMLAQQSGK